MNRLSAHGRSIYRESFSAWENCSLNKGIVAFIGLQNPMHSFSQLLRKGRASEKFISCDLLPDTQPI